jgi:hypothetical protein
MQIARCGATRERNREDATRVNSGLCTFGDVPRRGIG